MDTGYEYGVGTALPSMALRWRDRTGTAYDFSTGWTLACVVAPLADRYNVLTIVSTITVTGTASTGNDDPNIEVTFSATNLSQIVAAYQTTYLAGATMTEPVAMIAYVTATRTSDSLPMRFAAGDEPVWTLLPTVS